MKSQSELIKEAAVNAAKGHADEAVRLEDALNKVIVEGKMPCEALNISAKTMDTLYGYAYQLYNSGNYKNAAMLFSFLSLVNASEPKYRMGIAASKHMDKNYSEALDEYIGCVSLDPGNPVPFYHAADCWLKLNDPIMAACCLKNAIAIGMKSPKHADLVKRAGMALKPLIMSVRALAKVQQNTKKSG